MFFRYSIPNFFGIVKRPLRNTVNINFLRGLIKIFVNKVEICGVNTAKLPHLSEKEKQALFEKIQTGDKNARKEFIYGNLRLVLSVLQRFGGRGENVDDLFQVGCIGLIKALDNFDTSHGVKFSTYAVPIDVIWGNNAIY